MIAKHRCFKFMLSFQETQVRPVFSQMTRNYFVCLLEQSSANNETTWCSNEWDFASKERNETMQLILKLCIIFGTTAKSLQQSREHILNCLPGSFLNQNESSQKQLQTRFYLVTEKNVSIPSNMLHISRHFLTEYITNITSAKKQTNNSPSSIVFAKRTELVSTTCKESWQEIASPSRSVWFLCSP